MNRLKFLLFAVIAMALWAVWLAALGPGLAARGIEAATTSAQAAPHAVTLKIESLRSQLLAATLKAAASPAARQKPGRPEAPNAERVNAARAAAVESLGEFGKGKLVVGAFNDTGSLVAIGDADPAPSPNGFDLKSAVEAGAAGKIVDLENVPQLFYSAPVFSFDKGEVAVAGHLFLGLPLTVEAAALDQLSRDLNLVALGLAAGGKMVAVGGMDKRGLEGLLSVGKPGQVTLLNPGSVSELGPLKFPIMTAGDSTGGRAAMAVGFRRDVPGTPFEVLTIASTRGVMTALNDLQRFSVWALLGLLVLTIGVALLISEPAPEDEAPAVVAPQLAGRPITVPPAMAAAAAAAPPQADGEKLSLPTPSSLGIPDGPLGEEANPDDFQFGNELSRPEPATGPPVPDQDPGQDAPVGGPTEANQLPPLEPPRPDPFAELNAQQSAFDPGPDYSAEEGQRTVAYPVVSPFAPMGAGALGDPDFSPDQTRVAAVPKELLKASQRISQEVTAVNPKMMGSAAMPKVTPMGGPTGDETHWQEVFRDFVAMREKCGEPADGLTYEKFSAKLRKNKEQLVAKYNCRTVRFQVHAKEGKAALKATPVRD